MARPCPVADSVGERRGALLSRSSIDHPNDALWCVFSLPPDPIGAALESDGSMLLMDNPGVSRGHLDEELVVPGEECGRIRRLDSMGVPRCLAMHENPVPEPALPRLLRNLRDLRDEDVSLPPQHRARPPENCISARSYDAQDAAEQSVSTGATANES